MNSKQLINLTGAVLVLAIFVAALLLIALPTYSDSQRVSAQARSVAQSNSVYDLQIQTLRTQEEDSTAITAAVEELRAEIPVLPQQRDVFAIVADAADEAGATVASVVPADALPWVARTAPDMGETAEESADAAAPVDPAAEASADPAADASATPDPAASAPAESADEDSPQQQIPFTIEVTLQSSAQAFVFLDALAEGPRLISIVHTVLEKDGEAGLRLTVDVLAYVSTED